VLVGGAELGDGSCQLWHQLARWSGGRHDVNVDVAGDGAAGAQPSPVQSAIRPREIHRGPWLHWPSTNPAGRELLV